MRALCYVLQFLTKGTLPHLVTSPLPSSRGGPGPGAENRPRELRDVDRIFPFSTTSFVHSCVSCILDSVTFNRLCLYACAEISWLVYLSVWLFWLLLFFCYLFLFLL